MDTFLGNAQERFKTSTNAIALTIVKILSGLLVAVTLALIGDQVIGYGWLSFTLVVVVCTAVIFRIIRYWTWTHMVIFNLITILTGLVLRMYILIAPG